MLLAKPLFTSTGTSGRIIARYFSVSSVRHRQRVVILGSGWGGYNILRRIDKKRWGVYLIFNRRTKAIIL